MGLDDYLKFLNDWTSWIFNKSWFLRFAWFEINAVFYTTILPMYTKEVGSAMYVLDKYEISVKFYILCVVSLQCVSLKS